MSDRLGTEVLRLDEIDSREEWLDCPGVDWDADHSEVLALEIRAETDDLHFHGERDDVELGIITTDDEEVSLMFYTEDDGMSSTIKLTAGESARVAQQLSTAAKAARERGSTDVRT